MMTAPFRRSLTVAAVLSSAVMASRFPQSLSAAETPAAPADIASNVKDLGSPDATTAEAAVEHLQAAMTDQTRQAVALQEQILKVQEDLVAQLKALGAAPDDAAGTRVAGLLETNSAIYRWATQVATLPREQRDAAYAWGLKSENIQLLGKVYGHDASAASDAVHQIAKMEVSPATDAIFLVLIKSNDRELSLQAIDALYDRKPSPAIIDPLCDAAFYYLNQTGNRSQVRQVTIRGRTMGFVDQNYLSQDNQYVADLLAQYNDPHVRERLEAALSDLVKLDPNDARIRTAMSSNYAGSQGILKLIEAYKPKSIIPLCARMLASNINDNNTTSVPNNRGAVEQFLTSTRLSSAAMLILSTGQDPADYGFTKLTNYGDRWMLSTVSGNENDVYKKLVDWSGSHGKDFGIDKLDIPLAPDRNAGRRGPAGFGVPAGGLP